MSNKLYKILKYIALIAMPVITVLILAIAIIWQVPSGAGVALILASLNALLGVALCMASNAYEKIEKLKKDYKELDEKYGKLYFENMK